MTLYEAGIRNKDGEYTKLSNFSNRDLLETYIKTLKNIDFSNSELVILKKEYQLISTTPTVIR